MARLAPLRIELPRPLACGREERLACLRPDRFQHRSRGTGHSAGRAQAQDGGQVRQRREPVRSQGVGDALWERSPTQRQNRCVWQRPRIVGCELDTRAAVGPCRLSLERRVCGGLTIIIRRSNWRAARDLAEVRDAGGQGAQAGRARQGCSDDVSRGARVLREVRRGRHCGRPVSCGGLRGWQARAGARDDAVGAQGGRGAGGKQTGGEKRAEESRGDGGSGG